MANRIISALRRLVVSTAIRLAPVAALSMSQPEPRRRFAAGEDEALDSWLFGAADTQVASMARTLSGELDRVSSALEDLRALLADMARSSRVETVPVNALDAANYRWAEDILFDGDAVGFEVQPVLSVIGDQAFLFEDEPAHAPANWTVLRPALPDRSIFLAA